jgi:hypothetical protein
MKVDKPGELTTLRGGAANFCTAVLQGKVKNDNFSRHDVYISGIKTHLENLKAKKK